MVWLIIPETLPNDATMLVALATAVIVAGAIVLIRAGFGLRRSQTGAYYAIRKHNHARGIHLLQVGSMIAIGGLSLLGITRLVPSDAASVAEQLNPAWQAFSASLRTAPTRDQATPTAVAPTPVPTVALPVPTKTAAPTQTPLPSSTPIVPTTVSINPTLALLPTTPPMTPLPTATDVIASVATRTASTVVASATPRPTATLVPSGKPTAAVRAIKLESIASAFDFQDRPVGIATEFAAGAKSLFVFFGYQNLASDTPIQHIWFRDSTQLAVQRTIWSKAGSGTGYLTLLQPEGYKPGLYQVRVLLETEPAFVANFVVK